MLVKGTVTCFKVSSYLLRRWCLKKEAHAPQQTWCWCTASQGRSNWPSTNSKNVGSIAPLTKILADLGGKFTHSQANNRPHVIQKVASIFVCQVGTHPYNKECGHIPLKTLSRTHTSSHTPFMYCAQWWAKIYKLGHYVILAEEPDVAKVGAYTTT